MAEFPSPDETIFPTFNDVSPTLNKGRRWSEETLNVWLNKFTSSFVASGFTFPSSSVDLNLQVAAGDALIDGYLVQFPTAVTVTAIDNSTSYVFIRLKKTSGLVTEAVLAVESSPTPAGNEELLIGELVASSGVITQARFVAPTDQRGFDPNEALIFSNI